MNRHEVIENRNTGIIGKPAFTETVLYSGTKEECVRYEAEKRKEYRQLYGDEFGFFVDCFVVDKEEKENRKGFMEALAEYAATLTPEQKSEVIEISGKKYARYILNFTSQYYVKGDRKPGSPQAAGVSASGKEENAYGIK